MNICKNCGARLPDTAAVCTTCGQPPAPAAQDGGTAVPDMRFYPAGYSRRIDSDEVRSALKKNSRISAVSSVVLILLPFLGFVIYGAVSDKMDVGKAAAYGLILSAVFAFAAIIVALKKKLAKPFEGTVADKKISHKMSSSYDHGGRSRTKYTVRIDCEDGKRRKKEVPLPTYEYLNVGERVRYLPQFPQPFEKYDKRPDGDVLCMFCGRRNPLSEQNCSFCKNPLIK